MRALLDSTAPFWFAVFLLVCLAVFFALIAADEYVRWYDRRADHRRQGEAYRAEGMR